MIEKVNNCNDFGGRKRYVQWARERVNPSTVMTTSTTTLLSRNTTRTMSRLFSRELINSITKMAYKDDPTIFAWELINEPRCESDVSGALLQQWVKKMAAHVKEAIQFRYPRVGLGFHSNQLASTGGFCHNAYLRRPMVIRTERRGFSCFCGEMDAKNRNTYFGKLYDAVYSSAKSGGACVGGLFWQLLAQGIETFRDGYDVVLEENPSTAALIAQQSQRLQKLN
ncbi:hypothetical protein M0R45_006610 [Rubus argutus]|uniref:mannan endo-1,4-beta-mannosidase n=1 Tax=Rubus argutus TaxID=59490 RepID=A0AAW1YR27_RUBAR